jgi:ribose-phosphate pyrophosphokinase
LAAQVARLLDLELGRTDLGHFPDGELHVEVLEELRGQDVYLLQSLCPPADRHFLELLLLADVARRAGARTITGVIPYLAYARQDRRVTGREPLGGQVVVRHLEHAGIGQVVTVDLHSSAVEGFFSVPLHHLSMISILADSLRRDIKASSVVVSPDLGGVKRAELYARLLDRPLAVIHKSRVSASEVAVKGVVGQVRGCWPIIVDDLIATGGTLKAAIEALAGAGCSRGIIVAATHALLVTGAAERLRGLPIRRLITTDTIPSQAELPFAVERLSAAPILAQELRRLLSFA